MRLLAPLLFLVACGGDIAITRVAADADGDGYTEDVACDDAHRDVNPDAPELCNGVDDDCDGTADDEPATPTPTATATRRARSTVATHPPATWTQGGVASRYLSVLEGLGDVNADGNDDLVVGSRGMGGPYANLVGVFYGPVTGAVLAIAAR